MSACYFIRCLATVCSYIFFSIAMCVASSVTFAASAVENRVNNDTLQQEAPIGQFAPHRGNTETGNLAGNHFFESATVCQGCHTEIYDEWRSSMMANSWDDPIYRALLKKASIATDGKVDQFCTGCHTPVGLLTGKITSQINRQPPEAETEHLPGVDCESCHRMSGISGLTNGAYIIDNHSEKNIKRGPRSDASSPYHDTQFSGLHTRSEICGACHNVSHPFNDVPIERTYDEWYESAYRIEGVQCQDCHMPPTRGKAAIMGPERSDRATHRFAAANTTIIEHFGGTESVVAAQELLRTSATIEFESLPKMLKAGELVTIGVKVTNTGAGHKFPTGFPEGREVWIDFQVVDELDREVYRLGAIKNGKTEPNTKNFKVHLGNAQGEEVDVEVWTVDRVLSDNRILPKGCAEEHFSFVVPVTANQQLTLKASLNYWPFSQALADYLLGENVLRVKVETVASSLAVLPIAR